MSAKKKKAAKKAASKKKAPKASGSKKGAQTGQQAGKKRAARQKSPKSLYKKIEEQLLQRREELLQQIAGEVGLLQRDALSSVGDSADQAASAIQEELYSQLAEIEGQELRKIDNALQRIREGTYGICEDCGREIPIGRLQIMPYTTLCVDCQARQEEEEEAEGGTYTGTAAWVRAAELETLTAEEEEQPRSVDTTEKDLEEDEEELDTMETEESEEEEE